MSDLLGLGKIITTKQERDAIHIAVVPVIAGSILSPGWHIGLSSDGRAETLQCDHIGIVDPFLTTNIKEGEQFWMFLYPGSIPVRVNLGERDG